MKILCGLCTKDLGSASSAWVLWHGFKVCDSCFYFYRLSARRSENDPA